MYADVYTNMNFIVFFISEKQRNWFSKRNQPDAAVVVYVC